MEIFNNIYNFLKMLSVMDIVFFTSSIVLVILVTSLIYFISINKDVLYDNDINDNSKKEDESMEIKSEEKLQEENNINDLPLEEEYDDEKDALLNLDELTKKLRNQEDNDINDNNIELYEKEQEEKAIISYDELIKKHKNYNISYENTFSTDDLVVKKLSFDENKDNILEDSEVSNGVKAFNYDREEAFLDALKELNRILN